VSQNCSRKSFFAKLAGLIAAAGLLPKALASSEPKAAAPAEPKLQLRTDERSVARQEGTF